MADTTATGCLSSWVRDIAARGDARDLPDCAKQLGVHSDMVRFAIAGRTWVSLQ
jgi:hypothetical protein